MHRYSPGAGRDQAAESRVDLAAGIVPEVKTVSFAQQDIGIAGALKDQRVASRGREALAPDDNRTRGREAR